MGAIASFSVGHENGQCQLTDPENLYIPAFMAILKKNWIEKNVVASWRQFWNYNKDIPILMDNFP